MSKLSTPRVLISLGMTGFAALLAVSIWNRPSDIQFLMLALITMTALGAVTHPHWGVSLCAVSCALILYGLVWLVSDDVTFPVQDGLLGICLLVVTALGAWSLSRGLRTTERRLQRQEQLIEDLTIYDQSTGAIKAGHTQQILDYEIIRARRYKEPLTVAVVQMVKDPNRKQPLNMPSEKESRKNVTDLFIKKLRAVDRVGYGPSSEWLLVLPNTPHTGAEILSVRLIHMVSEQLGLSIVVGLATFPEDGSDSESLVNEARAALEFGRMNSMSMVSQALFDE